MEKLMNKFKLQNERLECLKQQKNQKAHYENLEESVERYIDRQMSKYRKILSRKDIKYNEDIFKTINKYAEQFEDVKEDVDKLYEIYPELNDEALLGIYNVDVKYLILRQFLIIIAEILNVTNVKFEDFDLLLDDFSELKKLYITYKASIQILDVIEDQLKLFDETLKELENSSC